MSERLGASMAALAQLVARLRAPDGCAWDQRQTLESMRPWLLEEAYEVLDALDSGDAKAHREELGDLLFQIVFQAQLRAEEGAFDLSAVAETIHAKMVARHPHVFGDAPNDGQPMGAARWAALKARERPRETILAGIPRALPALARAQKLGARAGAAGFDWLDADQVLPIIAGELAELAEARRGGDPQAVQHELGDVLFSVVNLARKLGVDAEGALAQANARFTARFEAIEAGLAHEGRRVEDTSPEELESRWQQAKAALNGRSA